MVTNKKKTIKELSEEHKNFSEFCRVYGVDRASAHNWVNHKCLPNAKTMVLIDEKSGNRLDFEKVIRDFNRANKKQ